MYFNGLVSWLSFDDSPTKDFEGNTVTAYGNPVIVDTDAINGKALQLDGSSYLKISDITLGGKDFYIDCWVNVDSSTPNYGRVLSIVNPSNGYHLASIRKNPDDATKLDFWANAYANVSQDYGYTHVSTINSIGSRVHVKLLYRYDNKYVRLYINDTMAAKYTSCPQYNRQTFDIYIGAYQNGNQGLIGTIDELRIYDGGFLTSGYGNPPTAADYDTTYTLNLDTERKITNAALTWRYENPGDADDLIVSSTVLTDLPATQSATGTAFYQTQRVKCFDLPNTPEVWLKFDVYFDGSNRWRAYNDNSNGVNGVCSYVNYSGVDFGMWQNNNNIQDFSGICKTNQLQTVLLHMISGSTTGVIEAWVDGSKIYTYTGDVNHGSDFADIYLQSDGSGTFFSNVIISNVEIGLDEVAALTYTFYLDTKRVLSDSNPAKVWLSFEDNSITDVYGHTVTTYGNPVVIDADTINGKALQLDGSSYLKISDIALGERDFVVDFGVNVDPSQTNSFRYFVISPLIGKSFVFLYTTYASNNSEIVVWLNKTSDLSSPYGQITGANFDSFIGSHIHIQLFYRYNHPGEILGHFRLCINGKMINTLPYNMSYQCYCERQLFDIFVGANLNGESCLTGTIDNFRIYETTNYTFNLDTQRRVIKAEPYNFDLDTERKLANVFDFYADTERRLVETINAYYTVQHDDKKYKFPLSRIRKGESFAVWRNGAPLYNELVDPSDPRAGIVHLWHNSREWALSDQIIVGEAIPATWEYSYSYQNYHYDFVKRDYTGRWEDWTCEMSGDSAYIYLPDEFNDRPKVNLTGDGETITYGYGYYIVGDMGEVLELVVYEPDFSQRELAIEWTTKITQNYITSPIYPQITGMSSTDAFVIDDDGGAVMSIVDGYDLNAVPMGGLLDYDLSVTSVEDVELVEGTDWIIGGASEVSLSPTAVANNPDGVKVSYKTYSVVDYDGSLGNSQGLAKPVLEPAVRQSSVTYQNYQRSFGEYVSWTNFDYWDWINGGDSSFMCLPDEFEDEPVINLTVDGVDVPHERYVYRVRMRDHVFVDCIAYDYVGSDVAVQWTTKITQINITSPIYNKNRVDGSIDAFVTDDNDGATMTVVSGYDLNATPMGGLLDYELSVTNIHDTPLIKDFHWVIGGESMISLSPVAAHTNSGGVKVSFKIYSVVDFDKNYGEPQAL